jgi:methyltransferase (TIGR00027 family)
MIEDQASTTALSVSVIRAVHQTLDELPHMLEDPVSLQLLNKETIQQISTESAKHGSARAKGLRSHIVLRSRYAEDRLYASYQSGIRQYISLGAGYDTFACRQPDWATNLKIIEIDHPATQSAKLKHFRNSGITFPKNTEFHSIDLEANGLRERLSQSTIDVSAPMFISCLGVLAYLRVETVEKIFRDIAEMPKGSRFVFAFAPYKREDADPQKGIESTAQRAAAHGEPWLTRFKVDELGKRLVDCGFSKVAFLEPEEAWQQYYQSRKDLPAPKSIRLCEASV